METYEYSNATIEDLWQIYLLALPTAALKAKAELKKRGIDESDFKRTLNYH